MGYEPRFLYERVHTVYTGSSKKKKKSVWSTTVVAFASLRRLLRQLDRAPRPIKHVVPDDSRCCAQRCQVTQILCRFVIFVFNPRRTTRPQSAVVFLAVAATEPAAI